MMSTAYDLWSNGRGWILITVSAGWAFSIGVRYIYPTLLPLIQSDFQIGMTTSGLLLSVLWGAYAMGHIPGGILGDRIGEGNTLLLSTVLAASTVLLVAISTSLWWLFIGSAVFGIATALYGPTRITIFSNIYPNHAGSAIGLTMAVGNVGNALFPIVAATIAAYSTWRLGFGMFVPLFIGTTIALWLTVPSYTSSQTSGVDKFSIQTIFRIARGVTQGAIPTFVLIHISASFITTGFAAFYPTYLMNVKGLSSGMAASLFGLFFASGAIIQPLAGNLMDKVGSRRTLIGIFTGSILALWTLPYFQGIGSLIIITILISIINGCFVITQTYISDTLPTEIQGTGFGTLKASWMLITATSPLIIGIFADYGYFNEAFLMLAVIGCIGFLLTIVRL